MYKSRRKLKARIRELSSDLAVSDIRLAQLRGTMITVSMPTELGIKPLYHVNIEYAIMLTNMMNGSDPGYKVEGMSVEVKSEYTPLMIPDEEDARYANDSSPWD